MRDTDFCERLKLITALPTLYVLGAWGHILKETNKRKLIEAQAYNQKPDRASMILAADNNTFAFDCSGLVKSVLWGFKGKYISLTGGATYQAGGVPDLNAAGLIGACLMVAKMSERDPDPGELLYMRGHCGVYVGNGKVVECSPKWKNGVQVTELSARKWEKHGYLPWIEYGQSVKVLTIPPASLRLGSRGVRVQQLQECLNALGADLKEDAIFGSKTKAALMDFQLHANIRIDGIYGPQTKAKLHDYLCDNTIGGMEG